MSADPRLAVTAFGLSFANPVLTASGTCGYGAELAESFPLASIGGLCTKGISLEPRAGNPAPRICETAAGMLNSIGLANLGQGRFERCNKIVRQIADETHGIREQHIGHV